MWFTLSTLFVALLQVFDLLSILLAVKLLSYNPIEIGLVSALWTLSLILGSRVYGKNADRGLFRETISVSIAFTLLYSILITISLKTGSKLFFALAYAMHAQAYSSVRITISTLILEYYDYHDWRNVSLRYATGVYLLEGLILITISLRGFQEIISNLAFILIPLLILPIILLNRLPRFDFLIERNLFRIDKLLNRTLMNIKNIVFTTPVLRGSIGDFQARDRGLTSVLLSIAGFVFSNEVFFTILPFILVKTRSLTIETVINMYGFGKLVSSILLTLLSRSVSKSGLAIAILIRSLALVTIYFYSNNPLATVSSLVIIYTSGLTINTTLYNLYNEATCGYGVYKYTILYETISLIGSISSGFLYKTYGLLLIPIAVVVKLALSSKLLSSK